MSELPINFTELLKARCFYCGKETLMRAYITDSSDGTEIVYPACCSSDECIAKWEPFTVDACPKEVLDDAKSRPKVARKM